MTDSSPSVTETPVSPAETVAQTTSTPAPDATAASSTAASGEETKETLLEAVLKVVPTGEDSGKEGASGQEATPASEQPQSEQDGEPAPTEAALSEDPTDEELAKYHSRTRTRIKQLLDQRNTARAEVDALRGDAETARGVRTFLQQNDIGKEDFALLLDLGAALRKGDFRSFYAGVKPYVDLAEEALGISLPADLRNLVQQGQMTTEAAKVLSQERYARVAAESQAQRVASQAQQVQTQHTQEALRTSINGAVTAWEQQVRQSDPDYGQKQALVKSMLHAVVAEAGPPRTAEQAVAVAQEAYKRANDQIASFRPKPQATAPTPSSVNRSAGATPEPKSLMEAAMLGLSRARQ